MPEYIERDALKKTIHASDLDNREKTALLLCVGAAPAADVATVVHGRWYGESDGYADGYPVIDVWYCSECGYCIDDGTDDPELLPNYCPNCGVKMDGEGSDE